MLKHSKEIFDILSKGGFISLNSVVQANRNYYDVIEDDFEAYRDYYEGVGFVLESGNGYFYFSRWTNLLVSATGLTVCIF